MKTATRLVTAACLVLFAASAAQAQLPDPMLVIAGPSYNTVMARLDYLGKLAGQPQLKQMAELMLAQFTQGQGIPGLDKDKPCGAVVFFPPGHQEPEFVVFVPIADAGAVAKLFQLPLQPDPQQQGVLVLRLPQAGLPGGGRPLYVKSQNGWTWTTSNARLLGKLPQDPGGWIGQLTQKYDLAVRFRMKAIPQQLRQQIVAMLQVGMQAGLEGADEQQRQMAQMQFRQLQEMLKSLDEITLGLKIDQQNKQFALGLEVEMSPGSALGRVLASIKVGSTRMAPFVPQEAMVRMLVTATMGKDGQDYALQQFLPLKQALLDLFEQQKEEFPDEDSFQAAKQLLEQAANLFEAMIKSGKIDAALAVENQQGKLFANLAAALPPGHKAEQLVKGFLEQAQAEGLPVQFNAASKDGVTYHRIPFGGGDEQLDALFGEDASLVLATGPQGCYLALGSKALEQLQQRIAASRTQPPRQAAHYEEVVFSVRPLLDLIQKHAPNPGLVLITDALPQDQKAQLRLFVDVEGTKQRVRLEVDEALVRVLVQLGTMFQGPGGPGALPGEAPPDF